MAYDLAPFVLGLILWLVQPLLDSVWQSRYELFEGRSASQTGAEWVADIASFLPTSSLIILGAFLLADSRQSKYSVPIILASICLLIVMFAIYGRAASNGRPDTEPKFRRSGLQWIIFALNIVGVFLVIFIPSK